MSDGAPVIIDASTLLDWASGEGYYQQAQALISAVRRRSLLAPPHPRAEVTNALYRRVCRTSNLPLTVVQAEQAPTDILSLDPVQPEVEDLYPRALALALRHDPRSVYDAIYVVLADAVTAEFWTADQNLINALGSAAPRVSWIGAYPWPSDSA